MCGICCVLSTSSCPGALLHSKLLSNLKKRGPDLSGAVESRVLCLHPVYKTRCRKPPIEHYLSEGVDVERSDTPKDCQEYPLDPSISKKNATSGELNFENDSLAIQKNTENDADIHNTGDSKGCTATTDFKNLGSDTTDSKQRKQCGSSERNSVYGSFFGQVLHLRGDPTPQPVEDEQGNILLWNGEVFDGLEVQGRNDTSVLSDLLCRARNAQDILNVMGAIRGPWSFIYWKEKTSQLWFGRDFFGRRSLLWLWAQSGARTMTFGLSSVASKTETGIPVET
ncbi:uncharacterized protein LOC129271544 isoform X1 [Lytechinus pictus]|uniref:uncharacterized protein LOC129271544 isoform X1 n=1 Tax=Lytechinus pictus TaxID=7653 RepID=UPI0030B9BCFD